jgi:hypothetical protein
MSLLYSLFALEHSKESEARMVNSFQYTSVAFDHNCEECRHKFVFAVGIKWESDVDTGELFSIVKYEMQLSGFLQSSGFGVDEESSCKQ